MTVLFIMLDGVRPDAIVKADCPTINAFIERGSSTMTARSVIPSVTLPCHTSIFHSVPPTRHGITTNTFIPMARPLPGLVEVIKSAGKRAAFFHNWEPLRDLCRPGNLYFSYWKDTSYDKDGDDHIVEIASRFINTEKPDFSFLYFGTVDVAGHNHGWMSPQYLRQLEHVDALLGELFKSISEDYSIIVHSDHGGHDRNHGSELEEDMIIPWMAAGPNIKRGYTIQKPVSLLDTAPTVARLLKIQPHHEWEGRFVDEIFRGTYV